MNTFCIQNGEVVLPDRSIPGGTVVIDGTRIGYAGEAIKTPRGTQEIDARGDYVTPGLIDVHIHGACLVGWETCSPEGFERLADNLMARGITRYVPGMMADEKVVGHVADMLRKSPQSDRMPGIYIEGPFISPDKRGGVQEKYVRPVNLGYLRHLNRIAGGRIRMMTFAPELKGAQKLPPAMRKLGIIPCVGHSLATAERAARVCSKGRFGCTHLYNAMSGLDHREPGLAAFALESDSVYTELNPDTVHVAPEMIRLTLRMKSANRIILISDAVVASGAKPGVYEYMNKKVRNSPRGVYYLDDGTLVGSSILLNQGVARFMKYTGAPVHDAVRMASLNPANLLGMGRRTGSLEKGKSADVVVFSRNFARARSVFRKGRPV